MIMRALLWKELRNYRTLLLLSAVFMSLPYLVVVFFVNTMDGEGMPEDAWIGNLQTACVVCLGIVVVLTSFVGGNAVAGERVERSAEFMGQLPLSRRTVITSKAVFCLGTCVLLGLVPVVIFIILEFAIRNAPYFQETRWPYAMITLATFLFGVSWLMSTMLRSPTNAAACAVFSAGAIGMGVALLATKTQIDSNALERGTWVMMPVIGVACFVIGIVYYLRRVEP